MLRRAMTHERSMEEMDEIGRTFVEKAVARGVARSAAEEVFRQLRGFAAYGFNKAHAACFAIVCNASAWLKAHYPAEFYCGLLNNQPMGFYSPRVVLNDARRWGLEVLPVDVNRSGEWFEVEGDGTALRVGLAYVKEMSGAARRAIVEGTRARRGSGRGRAAGGALRGPLRCLRPLPSRLQTPRRAPPRPPRSLVVAGRERPVRAAAPLPFVRRLRRPHRREPRDRREPRPRRRLRRPRRAPRRAPAAGAAALRRHAPDGAPARRRRGGPPPAGPQRRPRRASTSRASSSTSSSAPSTSCPRGRSSSACVPSSRSSASTSARTRCASSATRSRRSASPRSRASRRWSTGATCASPACSSAPRCPGSAPATAPCSSPSRTRPSSPRWWSSTTSYLKYGRVLKNAIYLYVEGELQNDEEHGLAVVAHRIADLLACVGKATRYRPSAPSAGKPPKRADAWELPEVQPQTRPGRTG